MNRLAAWTATLALSFPLPVRADYAPPPYDRYSPPPECDERDPRCADEPPIEPRSAVRLFTGPALRIAEDTRGGLFAAVDLGSRAAGGRLGGTWIGAGNAGGFSLYSAELWIDFGEGRSLHPILAAGAGLARAEHDDEGGAGVTASDLGVGVLRATLQYRLPVEGVDARAGVDVAGNVRAFGRDDVVPAAWLTTAAMVGIGF